MFKFSILIPSLIERLASLKTLTDGIRDQIDLLGAEEQVEIVTFVDNREQSTGSKRNKLLDQAQGDYIAFVDDDDEVSECYCRLILGALGSSPDVVGIKGVYNQDGAYRAIFEHSIRHKSWATSDNKTYLRPPNHLNPIRRKLALQTKFPDIVVGEDCDYSMRLLPLLKTEVMIEKPIYNYLARSK